VLILLTERGTRFACSICGVRRDALRCRVVFLLFICSRGYQTPFYEASIWNGSLKPGEVVLQILLCCKLGRRRIPFKSLGTNRPQEEKKKKKGGGGRPGFFAVARRNGLARNEMRRASGSDLSFEKQQPFWRVLRARVFFPSSLVPTTMFLHRLLRGSARYPKSAALERTNSDVVRDAQCATSSFTFGALAFPR
jgi:hypothetical protein